ncbi:MAG: rhomboid family intramembrane serine protease [Porticoccaceae bacterium]|nr:MAG: rhomboid family intramembrane serine protease [Porticoccaceae bacterium]
MFPLRDENPTFLTPWVTWGLAAACALVWLFVQGAGTEPALSSSICRYGLVPARVLGTAAEGQVVPLGPEWGCRLGAPGAFHTLVTSMFLHGSWFHLIGNLWFLWVFGNNVEDAMGHGRFLVFYLLCGLAAAALQMAMTGNPLVPMVGASGAIGGVMGAYVVLYPRVAVHLLVFLGFYATTVVVPAAFMLGYWFLLQLLGSLASLGHEGGGVAFWAHLGGFLAGVVLVFPFHRPELLARHPYYGLSRPSPRRFGRMR